MEDSVAFAIISAAFTIDRHSYYNFQLIFLTADLARYVIVAFLLNFFLAFTQNNELSSLFPQTPLGKGWEGGKAKSSHSNVQ